MAKGIEKWRTKKLYTLSFKYKPERNPQGIGNNSQKKSRRNNYLITADTYTL